MPLIKIKGFHPTAFNVQTVDYTINKPFCQGIDSVDTSDYTVTSAFREVRLRHDQGGVAVQLKQ